MWGTDWTRAVELLTYEQGVEAFRVTDQLSDSERSALMGGTLMKIYNWSPDVGRLVNDVMHLKLVSRRAPLVNQVTLAQLLSMCW